ncbi:MAG TPA: hypothetical protein VM735_02430 [Candidatus Kapabacteria bacterium]|nr:hypothetical protein [Candidatus Kapabacteria bacterium]
MKITQVLSAVILAGSLIPVTQAAAASAGMKAGAVNLKSAGPIAFGPDGILLVADTKAAAIVAIDTGEKQGAASEKPLKVEGINTKVAALLGTSVDQIIINDMAVHPETRTVYLAVARGRGPDASPVLVRVKQDGKPELVSLDQVKHSRAELPDAPVDGVVGQGNRQSNPRNESITDIAYLEDRVLVAGLSNEEFASTLRAIPFPFQTVANGTSVEIFHGAHGRFETRSPIRTFVPFKVGNEPQLLAAYTCTPLVQFPLKELAPGAKIKGKTIAELGNRNRPLDMIVYQKDGKDYLLMANSSRGIMKIDAAQIEKADKIEEKVDDKKGVTYQTIESWKGIDQLDKFDKNHALVLRRANETSVDLEAIPLP